MGILEFLFGKPKGTNGNDVLEGNDRNNVIFGRNGDDQINGNGGNDWLVGGKGDDILQGGKGNDVLYGSAGKDILLGGAGNDILYGDDKGHGHFFQWWGHKPPGYADYLDGQSGNDKVYGGSGNDFANYTMGENKGAHDLYDGGKGNDTLQITLTWAESQLTSVQQDIARFELFVSKPGNAGKTFEFKAFDLDVRNFEDVVVKILNSPPTARNDDGATSENQKLVVSLPASLLNNDTDPDTGDVITARPIVNGASTLGAVVNVNADGSYSYDPTSAASLQALKAGQSVVDTFQYTIQDKAGLTSTATVSITVLGANDAPVAKDDAYSLDEDTQLAIGAPGGVLANDTDAEHDALSSVIYQGPAHGVVELNANGSFTYTPDANYNGTDSFQYRTNDGAAPSGIATVTLTIKPVADAPEARDDAYSVDEDGVLTLDATTGVLANDTAADHDPIQAILVQGPAHGSLSLNADGSLVYTPNANYNGDDSFQYRASDGALDSGVATVNLTVNPVNDAPVANNDQYSTDEDTALVIGPVGGLTANDSDIDGDALQALVGLPQHGALTIGAGGVITYTPDANYHGTDSFQYVAFDGQATSNVATVTINVNSVNDAPVALDDKASTNEDTAITGSVLGNDTDADNDTLTIGNPGTFLSMLGATVVLNANGTYSYDPTSAANLQALNNGQTATDSFGYTIADGHGGTASATVSIDVSGVSDSAGSALPNRVSASVAPDAALDYYVRANGEGEWLHLDGFSLGWENAGAISSGSGGGAGKSSADDVVLKLGNSAQFMGLVGSLADGDTFKFFEIEAYKPGGLKGAALVDEFKLNNVTLNEFEGGNGGSSTLSLDYKSFTHAHVEYDAKGGASDVTITGWNFGTNKAETSTDAVKGDALAVPGNTVGGIPSDALDYYITFDGTNWLRLDSFSFGIENPEGQGGTGKATHSDVKVLIGSSSEILDITKAVATGSHIATVEIEAYRPGDTKQVLIDEFRFDNVLINGLQTGNASGNTVSFDYTAFTQIHTDLDGKGGAGAVTNLGWDFAKGEAIDTFDPATGDALKGKQPDSAEPGANLEYFVRFEDGDWIELNAFSLGLTNPFSLGGSGGGAGSGKVNASDVSLQLGSSGQFAEFTQALVSGKHIESAEIEVYKPGGGSGKLLIDEFRFEDVFFTGAGSGNGSSNSLSFDYGSFTHGHQDYDAKGGKAGSVPSVGWDVAQNKSLTGPAPAPDAIKVPLETQVAPGSLDYYVTFDGAGGWLKLDAFNLTMGASAGSQSGSGGGAGKATHEDVSLLLGSSSELLDLTKALVTGKHLTGFEIEAYRAGETKQLVEEFKFNDVLLTRIGTANATDNTVGFDFASFTHSHIEQDAKGGAGPITGVGWDFKAGGALAAPAPVADAGKALPLQSASPGTDLDYLVRFDNGEWMELSGFSLGWSNSGSVGGGSGGAGKVSPDDVLVHLGSSGELTALTQALASGKHIALVEIEAYKPGGADKQLIDEFQFKNVQLTQLQSGNGGSNTLGFDYDSFTHGHVTYDAKGGQTGSEVTGWDIAKGQVITNGPPPDADAVKVVLEQQVDPSSLDYYVYFDGADGWLRLEGFQFSLETLVSGTGGGGAGAGKLQADPVKLVLGSSSELLDLTQALASGKHLENVEIEAYASGGKGQVLVDEFRFTDVFISRLDTVNASRNYLEFDFGAFTHGHVEYDSKGGVGTTTVAGWDIEQNHSVAAPTPHADITIFG